MKLLVKLYMIYPRCLSEIRRRLTNLRCAKVLMVKSRGDLERGNGRIQPSRGNPDFYPPKVDCSCGFTCKKATWKASGENHRTLLSFCFRNFSEFISSTLRIPDLEDDVYRMISTSGFVVHPIFCFGLHLLFGRHHFQNILVQHHEAFLLTEKKAVVI